VLSVDFNGDQVVTGDDYTWLDTNAGSAADYQRLDEVLGNVAVTSSASGSSGTNCVSFPCTADFNGDGLITGDDYTWLDTNGGTSTEYARLDKALSVDFNNDGLISGDDFIPLDCNGGSAADYQRLSEVLGIA